MSVTPLTHGSLFAGIGGFDEGFRRAGMQCSWQVEKEPFCIAVLKTRFPDVERYYDVLKCGHDRTHKLRAVDVLTAGFPCQDLSVAGKRAGLAGSRSGLFWEVVRILGELRPAWFVLENVPGLFSSNEGRDFAVVLNALDELGYGVAWRVLNSQFFGVAQRRRRVFIVGRFGKPCPAEVLFESEGGGGDIETGGEERADVAVPLTSGIGNTGRPSGRRLEDDFNLAVFHENKGGNLASADHARALRSGASHTYQFATAVAENCRGEIREMDVMPALSVGGGKPGVGYPCVATALPASAGHHGHSSPRGDGSDNIIVQQAISSKWSKGSSGPAGDEHHTLIAIQDVRGHRDKKQNGIGIDTSGGAMYTLDGTSQHAVGTQVTSLSGMGSGGRPDDNDAQAGRIVSSPADTNGVRDFTGLLKGLDSARYRALGNAVTVSVAEWIAKRIVRLG